jgi:uncharacterized surface protein with fasciclin (FAS1) repeats
MDIIIQTFNKHLTGRLRAVILAQDLYKHSTRAARLAARTSIRKERRKMPHNIVETAREAGTFQTLLRAVDAAGLGETLADGAPFTVFAPTDAAFAALPQGIV